jgi:hypothetical protein
MAAPSVIAVQPEWAFIIIYSSGTTNTLKCSRRHAVEPHCDALVARTEASGTEEPPETHVQRHIWESHSGQCSSR